MIVAMTAGDIYAMSGTAAPQTTTQKKSTKKINASSSAAKKQTSAKGRKTNNSSSKRSKGNTAAKKNTPAKKETSADVKKRQEATQREIRLTEQQIKENEKSVKIGLAELGKLEGDISLSKKKIAETSGKIKNLTGEIGGLETSIDKNEKELQRLRDEYLKAVKKIRATNKSRSTMAFIFASENFSQALRRMRYLKQFSSWKDRQSSAITEKTNSLKSQRDRLASAREAHNKALQQQEAEQATLNKQYNRQNDLVAGLKANGTALKTHLSKKQAEANELRNRISALIAEEHRRAAEEKARQEAARKAAEERKERERLEALERQLALEEKARKEKEEAAVAAAAEEARLAREAAQKAKDDKKAAEKARKAEEKLKKEQEKLKKEQERARIEAEKRAKQKTVATARKREPAAPAATSKAEAGNFASLKGSLPRPVSGSFRVTSRFGRQSLPDLPDVVYDNPGIDAEVSRGASALAVYGGKVSGVYMIPGYNTVVIVNHGSYYTVYGNIGSPAVKVGDKVNAGQALGALAPDEDDTGNSSIHFEVWRNREKLNPLEWIR